MDRQLRAERRRMRLGPADSRANAFAGVLLCGMFTLTVLSGACGAQLNSAQPTPSAETKLAIATDSEFRNVGMTALIVGTMHGTVNGDGTACFRLDEDPRLPMFWPKGYSARTDPLRVVDREGKTVAVDGHRVKLSGGTADFSTSRIVVGCGEAKQVLAVG